VVPKHRRSEFELSLTSVGAPGNQAESWAEAVAYGQSAYATVMPAGNGYHPSNGYDGNGYDGGAAEPDRTAPPPKGLSWQDRQDLDFWQDWGPPPELHPDHPSAPVPRIQFPADRPSGPMSAPRAPHGPRRPDLPQRRPGGSARTGSHQVPRQPRAGLTAPDRPDTTGARRFQQQADRSWQQPTDYRRETGPSRAGPGPSGQRAQFGAGGQAVALADPARRRDPQDGGSRGVPGQILADADRQASAIREAAEQDAAAIRMQATAIREAAEKDAEEMRTAILSMAEQLTRMSAYVAESFPASKGITTVLAAGAPAALAVTSPAVLPAAPTTRPARPATAPGTARPTGKPGKSTSPNTTSRGRQARAARKMVAILATLVAFGVISGATELALHGGPFFIFRANGAGATETGPVENQGPGQPHAPGVQHVHAPKHAK
jgi:hypothetical protein